MREEISEYDGITHINAYSRGKTDLGRMLSNFYHFPFYAEEGLFQSIEGYYHWLSIADYIDKDILKKLYGYNAAKTGQSLRNLYGDRKDPNFEEKILAAVECKFKACDGLLVPEYYELPFYHYYVYGGHCVYPANSEWWLDGITRIRNKIVSERI